MPLSHTTDDTKRWKSALSAASILVLLAATGCHHNPRSAQYVAPPMPAYQYYAHNRPNEARKPTPRRETPSVSSQLPETITGRPILTETGMASWYGTVYDKHAAADGTTFDKNAMTAAHRTLPLGTTVRVTNVANNESVVVRITDRGPFVRGRILDLSMGAAKAIGVYTAGVAKVKIEAFAHNSVDTPGKWCVQTGGFRSEDDAMKLKNKLMRRYTTARVIEFAGPTGYWVRIDPSLHSKSQATEIAAWIGEPNPSALPYLVRLD